MSQPMAERIERIEFASARVSEAIQAMRCVSPGANERREHFNLTAKAISESVEYLTSAFYSVKAAKKQIESEGHSRKPEDFPRKLFRDQTILGLDFVDTCTSNPEQYDVWQGDRLVGYVRQRTHELTAQVGGVRGPVILRFVSQDSGTLLNAERHEVLCMVAQSIKLHMRTATEAAE